MAQILEMDEFVRQYSKKIEDYEMEELMKLEPGKSYVIGFGWTRHEDVVFVRVTKFHMATMSVFEFNGIK